MAKRKSDVTPTDTGAKVVVEGAGITAREIRIVDWDPIFEADDEMRKTLGRDPDYFDWGAYAPLQCAEKMLSEGIPEGGYQPDSDYDYALRIKGLYERVRRHIDRGEAAEAAYYAVLFGETLESLRIKDLHEKAWETGLETNQHLDKGRKEGVKARKEYAEKAHENMRKINNDLIRDRPDMSKAARVRWIRERVKKQNGEDYSTTQVHDVIGAST